MERYRVSLILATPQFDTSNTIARYAQNKDDLATLQAWRWLKRRTELHYDYQAFSNGGADAMYSRKAFALGALEDLGPRNPAAENVLDPDKIAAMSKEDSQKLYLAICESAGIHIDPATFVSKDEQKVTDGR